MKRPMSALVVLVLAACVPPEVIEMPAPRVPSAARLTVECARRSVFAWNPDRSLQGGGRVPCTVYVADRLGLPLDGVTVSLSTEAGTFSVREGTTIDGAFATEFIVSEPTPKDVAPGRFAASVVTDSLHTGTRIAPAWMAPVDWHPNPVVFGLNAPGDEPQRADPLRPGVTNNPRDNLVKIIAVVQGEEAFSDENANAFREATESFTDLTEPFVDSDDDGTRGSDELFVDANGNGQWDGKNDSWDSSTKIWAATHLLWTGLPHASDSSRMQLRYSVGATDPTILLGQSPWQTTVGFLSSDPWFNGFSDATGCSFTADPRLSVSSRSLESVYQQDLVIAFVHSISVRDLLPRSSRSTYPVQLTCTFGRDPGRSFTLQAFEVRIDFP